MTRPTLLSESTNVSHLPQDIPPVKIRSAGPGDMLAIHRIYAHHVLRGVGSFEIEPPALTEMNRRREEVLDRGLPYLVAEENGDIQGFAYAGPFRPRAAYRFAVENSVYTQPDSQRRGIGRALLQEVIALCRLAGMRRMVAVIGGGETRNPASVQLHRALGFEIVGILPGVGYKFGEWLDAAILQRSLDPE